MRLQLSPFAKTCALQSHGIPWPSAWLRGPSLQLLYLNRSDPLDEPYFLHPILVLSNIIQVADSTRNGYSLTYSFLSNTSVELHRLRGLFAPRRLRDV